MEHLSEEQIVSYRARSLSASEVLSVSDHLLECETCRVRVSEGAGWAGTAAMVRARLTSEAGAFAHLTYEEIAAYADRTPSAAETVRVNEHIRDCAACAADVRDLRTLKAEIGESSRLKAVPRWRAVFALATVAACVLLIAVILRPRPTAPIAEVQPPPAEVIADGNRKITISAQRVVAGLDGLPDPVRAAVETALAARRIDVPADIAALAAKRDVLLGAPTANRGTELLEPVGVVVESQSPLFRWKPVPGAEFQVSVYTGDFQQGAVSRWIRDSEWRAPVALSRGASYSWQLTVRADGREFTAPMPPEPEARFQILDAASEDNLAHARSASEGSHVVMGVAYARAGLRKEARQELQTAADQNPGSSTIAALLAGLNSDQRPPK
jgi:hypothetical protein